MVKEEIRLDSITTNYYSCNICKNEEVILDFGNAKILFVKCLIFKCGYPNEEIYMHYDYYDQGSMVKYTLYEVLNSEWIKALIEMNKVHSRHSDKLFEADRHFIILFEDEVFECIAQSY